MLYIRNGRRIWTQLMTKRLALSAMRKVQWENGITLVANYRLFWSKCKKSTVWNMANQDKWLNIIYAMNRSNKTQIISCLANIKGKTKRFTHEIPKASSSCNRSHLFPGCMCSRNQAYFITLHVIMLREKYFESDTLGLRLLHTFNCNRCKKCSVGSIL